MKKKEILVKVNAWGASHRGNLRVHNEDNIYVDGIFRDELSEDNILIHSRRRASPYVYAVFDGLGGEACGEEASLIAALGLKAMEDINAASDIETYVTAAHKAIINESVRKNAPNMGTTVASVQIFDDHATVFNVGDSRVYLYRDNMLTQISRDHSVVQSLIDRGLLKEEERHTSRYAGELTQYIGMESDEDIRPQVYKTTTSIRSGDVFLICSDGLNDEMSDAQLHDFLEDNSKSGAEAIAAKLIKKATDGKCIDNLSVIVCKLVN